ncbi:hypothetical protein DFQ01_13049 [Paenibacillus cellulosilyticus]|uniref:Uncharacterized protein n=1 Tax=Paenibacillus cellulosilyticus TaxID=375489 RepID=A0A2V2YLV2_9BACL|nr:hypothetical protein [Paenibacillus cellulosilyticus]PWV94484.1 hypothetical protein DFQ01_13049 [Paenibacillus cellulosilyticus]QKS44996.1 hypothetical protein HUB94_11670 [Paenibacillus cellulosilyticus]
MTYKLYHYFDRELGPFRNLSKLTSEESEEVSNQIRLSGTTFASRRSEDYMRVRRELEAMARERFIAKGGKPRNSFPHYMTLGPCDWLKSWYVNPDVIEIPWDNFMDDSVSFTYGDLFPTMRYHDDKPYRKQVYTKLEIMELIAKYGFPQDWNKDGDKGPERYIEVQVWDENELGRYMK